MRCLDGITDSMDMSLSKLQGMVKAREVGKESDMTEQLNSNKATKEFPKEILKLRVFKNRSKKYE